MMEWINTTAVIMAFVLSGFNLWDRIDARKKAAQEPTKKLETRIENLERIITVDHKAIFAEYETRFKSDLTRIEAIEEGNRVTHKALLALLAHARDGNNVKQLEDAEDELKEYLINR